MRSVGGDATRVSRGAGAWGATGIPGNERGAAAKLAANWLEVGGVEKLGWWSTMPEDPSSTTSSSLSSEELLGLVYDELRRLAASRLARERPGHTLQATALVHEAWLKLSGNGSQWRDRSHFFGAAAKAMRRILVDNARRRAQLKRGGNPERVDLPESQVAAPDGDDRVLEINAVLDELAAEDAMKAKIVKLRCFVGLNHLEIADALGVNEKTVRRNWELAKLRLFELITGASGGRGSS